MVAKTHPKVTRPPGSSNVERSSDLDVDFDLNSVIVEINLEKLVLDLEAAPASEPPQVTEQPPPADTEQSPQIDTETPLLERRVSTRLSKAEVGDDVQVSLPRAASTVVVNVSESGVLIETNCPLFPGRTTDVFVKLRGERQALRATVVRSSLHALTSDKVVYRSALQFERVIGLAERLAR